MNKRAAKIGLGIVTIFMCIVSSLFVLPLRPAVAAPSDTSIMKKTLANAITTCYNSSYVKKDITPAGQFTTEDIFVYHFLNKNKGTVLVLDSLGGTINCEQVFLGSNKVQGLNSLFGNNPTTPVSLGYEKSGEDNPSSTRCMQMKYKHKSADTGYMVEYTSNSLCFGVMSDGIVDMNSFPSGGVPGFECVDPICLSANIQGKVFVNWLDNDGIHREWEVAYFDTNSFAGGDGTKWDDLYKAVTDEVSVMGSDQGYANVSMSQTKIDDPGAFASYTITDYSKAAEAAFEYYTGSSNMDSQKFNSEDVVYLLEKAYAKMRDVDKIITEDSKCFAGKDEALNQGTAYAHYNEGKKMWCPVFLNTGTAAGKTYNVVGNTYKGLFAASPERVLELLTNRNLGYATAGDMCVENARKRYDEFDQAWKDEDAKGENKDSTKLQYYKEQQKVIRQMLNKAGGTYKTENGQVVCLDLPTIDGAPETPPPTEDNNDGGTTPPPSSSTPGANGSATDLDQCYDSAGALGWILCPVISFVSSATDNIYNDYIQSEFLEFKSDNVKVGSDIYGSWRALRDIANVLFIIMFLIVMASQFTGIGISNYGIKKILPRLIMVAVLVNISFVLCQFAVDLSNVLGYSFNEIFVKLAPDVDRNMGALGVVGSGIASGLTWAAIVAVAVQTAGAWLIPLLLALLTGIVSVIFGGIILGLRQAGIIILIVLSPVAAVCYALPNAKSFFDRWMKMFTSLLMVFPICGALMGGGYFASNLIVKSTDSVLLSIIAMLIRVAPFFMIPSLTRAAMVAIGNVGNKVANWGNRMGRNATGAISKSDLAKRGDAVLNKSQGDMTALRGRLLNRLLGKDPNDLSDRRKAKIARQYAKYNKLRGEEATALPYAMGPGSREYDAMKNAARQNRIDSLAKNIALENTDIATDNAALGEKLDRAMLDYNADGSDENLAAMQAYQNMLVANGDEGISVAENSLGRANVAGLNNSAREFGRHLVRSHAKDVKPVARGFYSAAVAASEGKLQRGAYTKDSDGLYTSMGHMKSSVSGYDPATLGKINESTLNRMLNNMGELKKDDDFIKTFDQLSAKALTNPTLHVQPKVAEKINKVRTGLGLTTITNNSGSSDSGPINVRNSGGDGTVLRTGNDNRPSDPLPNAMREGENYRQNSSGIWLPPNS